MTKITEAEFARIVNGIIDDRESIVRHNPMGSDEEILLWMLLSCLVSYLNLTEVETPCFTGRPDAVMYFESLRFVLRNRKEPEFNEDSYLKSLLSPTATDL